jgi:hypothetical protein
MFIPSGPIASHPIPKLSASAEGYKMPAALANSQQLFVKDHPPQHTFSPRANVSTLPFVRHTIKQKVMEKSVFDVAKRGRRGKVIPSARSIAGD